VDYYRQRQLQQTKRLARRASKQRDKHILGRHIKQIIYTVAVDRALARKKHADTWKSKNSE